MTSHMLDGEYVFNPLDLPNRFKNIAPCDFAIFDFEGDLFPTEARVVFVAAGVTEDTNLHAGLTDFGVVSKRPIELAELTLIVHASGTPQSHPVYELLLDASIEDAARNGLEGTRRLLSRRAGRKMTRTELARARQRTDEIGRLGEELLNEYFATECAAGRFGNHEWKSSDNAIAPFDFSVISVDGSSRKKVEVKSTTGDFRQIIHFSMAELIEMRESTERYDVYRVYALDDRRANLRIAEDAKTFAEQILPHLLALPQGVTVDSVSVRPDLLVFGDEIVVELPPIDEEGI